MNDSKNQSCVINLAAPKRVF